MLGAPEDGWSKFSLGKQTFWLSHLTCVPIEWLDQAIHGLETLEPFIVHGQLEPTRLLCIVSYWECHIIVEEQNPKEPMLDDEYSETDQVSMIEFCQMLYEDILNNFNKWQYWRLDDDDRPYIKKRELRSRLKKLEHLISKRSCCFEKNSFFW